MQAKERTLVLIKPDAVARGLIGEIISRFERVGLKIVGMKMIAPNDEHYYHHYETIGKVATRRGKEVFDVNLAFMKEGPVVALVLEGIEAVSLVRKMVGSTEPKAALPGTIRGDYSHISYGHADNEKIGIPNVVHASGDSEDARQEVPHWFSESELVEYESRHEHFTQPKKRKQ
jgi:nucleoside-diphosphate kinase